MPVPHRIRDTDIHIEGNGPQTIVMVHGWPDTWRLWDKQVAALKDRYRCVRFSLPGFEPGSPLQPTSLDDIVALMRAIVEEVNDGQPAILLLHDWGCVFGYQFALRHPELVLRVIGIDIGDAGSPEHVRELPLRAKLGIAGYQLWLALAWRICGTLGTRMTRWMADKLQCPTDPATIHDGMNYPYDITWAGSHGSYRHVLPVQPKWPLLFIYGTRKPLMFHSRAWLEKLRADSRCRVVGFETRHWVQVEEVEEVNRAIGEWLDEKAPERVA